MSNEKRLLSSWPSFNSLKTLNEGMKPDYEQNSRIILSGILQKADTLNQNGRIYPKNILKREVANYQKYIKERRATGEVDHPESSVISLLNIGHNILECYIDNDIVFGKIELLNTPSGKILQTLVEDNIKLGISSRGVGSTIKDGDYYVVQDDFQLICWDMVSEPSTPGAFMLPEHASFLPEGKKLSGTYDNAISLKETSYVSSNLQLDSNLIFDILSMKK